MKRRRGRAVRRGSARRIAAVRSGAGCAAASICLGGGFRQPVKGVVQASASIGRMDSRPTSCCLGRPTPIPAVTYPKKPAAGMRQAGRDSSRRPFYPDSKCHSPAIRSAGARRAEHFGPDDRSRQVVAAEHASRFVRRKPGRFRHRRRLRGRRGTNGCRGLRGCRLLVREKSLSGSGGIVRFRFHRQAERPIRPLRAGRMGRRRSRDRLRFAPCSRRLRQARVIIRPSAGRILCPPRRTRRGKHRRPAEIRHPVRRPAGWPVLRRTLQRGFAKEHRIDQTDHEDDHIQMSHQEIGQRLQATASLLRVSRLARRRFERVRIISCRRFRCAAHPPSGRSIPAFACPLRYFSNSCSP